MDYMGTIKKETLGDQITTLLKERIINGEWDIGNKIPSENDLAAEFGVSRLTIRLSIQKLIALGLIETRIGEGNYIRKFSYAWYMEQISDILIKPGMLDDVQDFRRLLEIESARLAIENASDAQIEELDFYAKSFDEFTYNTDLDFETNLDLYAEIDYKFHHKICEVSNNSLILLAFTAAKEPIFQYFKTIVRARWELYFSENTNIKDSKIKFPRNAHRDLYIAIKEKDFDQFKSAYYKMVNYKVPNY